jgi:hypothetical protein
MVFLLAILRILINRYQSSQENAASNSRVVEISLTMQCFALASWKEGEY